ncbi:MAG: DUF523 domain-containing protein [Planctomycetota bacterium]
MSIFPLKHPPIVVSACLFGLSCRYDGAARPASLSGRVTELDPLLPACPEELGGLPTPRPACELWDGDGAAVLAGRARVLVRGGGEDRTEAFLRGARRLADLARSCGSERAILKARSPSCGVRSSWREGGLRPGPGVASAALRAAGLRVEEIDA